MKRATLVSAMVIILVLVMGLASPLIAGPAASADGDVVVTFADPNLETAIRDAISKPPPDPIYQSDLVNLTYLDAGGRSISNLSGLEYCTNLTELRLQLNQIIDISPLSGLTSLTQLQLQSNQISNIMLLSDLTSLTLLYLGSNQISNISPLSGLGSLTWLDLSGNQINNIGPLSDLTSLTRLYLGSNQITELSPLSDLTNLTILWLHQNLISEISSLSGLTSLTRLDLGSNQITEISPLSDLTNLTILALPANQIGNITPLSDLTSLTWLDLSINQIGNISPLSAFTSLQNLYLDHNLISDISALVDNSGLGIGDIVHFRWNYLDLDESSTDWADIQVLIARCSEVLYWPQYQNLAPTVGAITAPIDPVPVNLTINASATFNDPGALDTHTADWYWGDGTTSQVSVSEENGSVSGSHYYTDAGVYAITLMVTDDDGGQGTSVFQYVVVYDPSGGFVTGGGWIDSPSGAYTPEDNTDPDLKGKATFGFVSKYKKGATVPTGQTEFQFHVANLNFQSTSYQWLVIAGAKAHYKGWGTINGTGDYCFMLTAIDGQINGGVGLDKFRIQIWDENNNEALVYDNQVGELNDYADPTTAIAGGSIVIHK